MTTIATNSNIVTNTAPSVYQHFATRTSRTRAVKILPPIREEDVLDGSQFLEDMDSILEGVTASTSTTNAAADTKQSVLEECHYYRKPRLTRDLTALMTENERELFVGGQRTPSGTLRQRMETYLSSRTLQNVQGDASEPTTANVNGENGSNQVGTSKMSTKDPDDIVEHNISMVWGIQPVPNDDIDNHSNKDGRIRFKITTDFGACFVSKEKEAMEFVEILKKTSTKSPCKTFYQVFTFDGKESCIVKRDGITSLLHEMLAQHKLDSTMDADNIPLNNEKRGPARRFARYLNRRRLKNLIRRQVDIAVGTVRKSRGRVILLPFRLIWKVIFRRGTTF